jgi:hypothetical protein
MSRIIDEIVEDIYEQLSRDNEGLDPLIKEVKLAMAESGQDQLLMQTDRLAQNNRQGRKLLQAYFRQRGVKVEFAHS